MDLTILIPRSYLFRDNSGGDERAFRSAIASALEINANVLTFARNISGIAGTDGGMMAASSAKYARILFTPSLAEAEERSAYDGEEASHTVHCNSSFSISSAG